MLNTRSNPNPIKSKLHFIEAIEKHEFCVKLIKLQKRRKYKENIFAAFLTDARMAVKENQTELEFKINILTYLKDFINNEKNKDIRNMGKELLSSLEALIENQKEIIQIRDSPNHSELDFLNDSRSILNYDDILKQRRKNENKPQDDRNKDGFYHINDKKTERKQKDDKIKHLIHKPLEKKSENNPKDDKNNDFHHKLIEKLDMKSKSSTKRKCLLRNRNEVLLIEEKEERKNHPDLKTHKISNNKKVIESNPIEALDKFEKPAKHPRKTRGNKNDQDEKIDFEFEEPKNLKRKRNPKNELVSPGIYPTKQLKLDNKAPIRIESKKYDMKNVSFLNKTNNSILNNSFIKNPKNTSFLFNNSMINESIMNQSKMIKKKNLFNKNTIINESLMIEKKKDIEIKSPLIVQEPINIAINGIKQKAIRSQKIENLNILDSLDKKTANININNIIDSNKKATNININNNLKLDSSKKGPQIKINIINRANDLKKGIEILTSNNNNDNEKHAENKTNVIKLSNDPSKLMNKNSDLLKGQIKIVSSQELNKKITVLKNGAQMKPELKNKDENKERELGNEPTRRGRKNKSLKSILLRKDEENPNEIFLVKESPKKPEKKRFNFLIKNIDKSQDQEKKPEIKTRSNTLPNGKLQMNNSYIVELELKAKPQRSRKQIIDLNKIEENREDDLPEDVMISDSESEYSKVKKRKYKKRSVKSRRKSAGANINEPLQKKIDEECENIHVNHYIKKELDEATLTEKRAHIYNELSTLQPPSLIKFFQNLEFTCSPYLAKTFDNKKYFLNIEDNDALQFIEKSLDEHREKYKDGIFKSKPKKKTILKTWN